MAHADDSHAITEGKLAERRFAAELSDMAGLKHLAVGVGAAALGAGTYGAWMHDVPMAATPYLFVAGAAAILGAFLLSSGDDAPLRVGALGVAIERAGTQPERIGWYEVEKVTLEGGDRVVVEGQKRRIVASVSRHPQAAGWILKEALTRIPKRVSVEPSRSDGLVERATENGQILAVDPPQIAGRRCRASDVVISFERDGRTCGRCGEVYDRKHLPAACLACEAPMEG